MKQYQRKKISHDEISAIMCEGEGYRADAFAWDPEQGCWRAIRSDEYLAMEVMSATGKECHPLVILRWRRKNRIAPSPRGRKKAQKYAAPKDDYDVVIQNHIWDVLELSRPCENHMSISV